MEHLFSPRDGKTTNERTEISLLKTSTSSYKHALYRLISDWVDGKIGEEAPVDDWDKELVRKTNEHANKVVSISGDSHDENEADLYTVLQEQKVLNHLKTVNSHRRWLRLTQNFFEKIGIVFSEKLKELVIIHDLSKYTHWESLGYAVMFGDCQVDWKKLEDEDEKTEWAESLEHHYATNPHHPEFFFPKLEEGGRDKSRGMLDLDKENGEDYLIESLIDMLASRGQRVLKHDKVFSVAKWMHMEPKYMMRYNEADREFVNELIGKWKAATEKLDITNAAEFQGHFDERPVVN